MKHRLWVASVTLVVLFIAVLVVGLRSGLSRFQRSSERASGNALRVTAGSQAPGSPQRGITSSNVKSSIATNASAIIARRAAVVTNTPSPSDEGQISADVLKQIAALEAAKEIRTPTQQKIDSQILHADSMQRGVPIADGVLAQRVDFDKDEHGRILVDIKADVTDELLRHIEALGGKVINSFAQYQSVRAGLPLENIQDLARRTEVYFVRPAIRATHNNVDSQGDYTHQTITTRATFGVNGGGVKVGVISGSADYLASSQIAGKVTVLSGQGGSPDTGEGTAMLEIVNDLAPGAQLYFATAKGGTANFANNILQLQAVGCSIIVDDILSVDEPPFQDGPIAQAVNSATAGGVLYFSSAGNYGSKTMGTSGTWEGDFVDSGLDPTNSSRIHSFPGGIPYDVVSVTGSSVGPLGLFWTDPLGKSTNDYDVYVMDSAGGSIVASSLNSQTGSQDPYESVPTLLNGERLVIVKFRGAGRFLHLDALGGRLNVSTQGSTRGHNCAANAFSVAATDANKSYPNSFSGGALNPIENYSSDGPRRVFFQANGTPITPGNFSSTGGAVRQKPDITAADKVSTDVPGFQPFAGTSAAAPHAAAIAALLKSYNPSLTPSQVRTILTGTALDIMSAGVDRDSGAGIVMASSALAAAPGSDLTRRTDSLNNLSPRPGDVVTASLTITNQSCSGSGAAAGAFHIGFYWSTNPSFVGATPFYETLVAGCSANSTVVLNQNITIASGNTPGTYYLGYGINDQSEVGECNRNNNGIFYWTVTVLPSDGVPPTVKITSPVSGSNYSTLLNTINLGGTASDNVRVTQVSWSNNRGGSGTASGTTTWTASAIPLQTGTNLITVSARDAANNIGQATLTVAYNVPPTIATQPQSTAVAAGYPATLAVTANGVPTPACQWYFNGNPIPGANSPVYSIPNVQPTNAGAYRVVVANSVGSAPSDTVTLTVGFPYTFTTLAGSLSLGSADGIGSAALFQGASGLAVDKSGNVYVADTGNNTIRRITRTGAVTTLAGLAGSPGSVDGIGSNARFNYPYSVAVDSAGSVYVADRLNSTVRKVTPTGVVTTLAGLAGNPGSTDGIGNTARFNYLLGVAVDDTGNVYVADEVNSTIRKVTPAGVVTTLAGLAGNPGSTDGTGTNARFNNPRGVAVDTQGNLYVADFGNSSIRKITPAGMVTTLVGLAGNPGSADKVGTDARFNLPNGVAVDNAGNIYVADTDNHTIRKVTPTGLVTTLAGLAPTSGSADGTGTGARFYYPRGVAVDSTGNLYVADSSNNTIRFGWLFPKLQITRSGDQVVLSWPASPTTFGLEAVNGLLATNWFPVSPQPVVIQNQSVVTNATSGGVKIFRLKLP